MRKKTKLKTFEEMPLEELESQIWDEGQFIMVTSMLVTDSRDKMLDLQHEMQFCKII